MPASAASFLPSWMRTPTRTAVRNSNKRVTSDGSGKVMMAADAAAADTKQGAQQQRGQHHERPSAGTHQYNVSQLTALRDHVASTAMGLPATAACAALRTSNEALLSQLDHEIARQGSLLLAAQSDAFGGGGSSATPTDDEDDDGSSSGGSTTAASSSCQHSMGTGGVTVTALPIPIEEMRHDRAVARHFALAQQARLAAQLEVRNAEAAAYVEHRAKLKTRKVQALTRRLACYLVALMLLVAGFSTFLAVPAAHGILLFFALTMCLAVVFVVMGYIMGESWRLRAASERELRRRIERRADEILAEFQETYRVQQEEERRRLEEQRRQEEEEEERRKEAERIADEELLRSIEAGKTTTRRSNRYGKGSVSSTDIKLPDATSSCCDTEATLHAGVAAAAAAAAATDKKKAPVQGEGGQGGPAATVVGIEDSEAGPLVIPTKVTPRSAHLAVRRWFVGKVFGVKAASSGAENKEEGEEGEEEEKTEGGPGSVWV